MLNYTFKIGIEGPFISIKNFPYGCFLHFGDSLEASLIQQFSMAGIGKLP